MRQSLLIVEDDEEYLSILTGHFESQGFEVLSAMNGNDVVDRLRDRAVDLIVLDVSLGEESGIDLIVKIKGLHPATPIIMLSSHSDTRFVVDAMKRGASDYLIKPPSFSEMDRKITDLINMNQVMSTERELQNLHGQKIIVGSSHKTKQLVRDLSRMANSDGTVFLRGESGTGKSLIAELIHLYSNRKNHPFVTINCAAIPENLLESELFGHEKGSFTGAIRQKFGKFEFAHKGTIFLDEIGDLTPELQVKLLRVIQSQEFEHVGGLKTIHVDVRIVAATNRNIEELVQQHKFREDLFYRLNVLPIQMPPLRERKEDIPMLVRHFFEVYSRKTNKNFHPLNQIITDKLSSYTWPGNIRELQNVVERAIIIGKEPHLYPSDFLLINNTPNNTHAPEPENFKSITELEHQTLVKAIRQSGGNLSRASKILGIGRNTLYRRLKKYDIKSKHML